MHIAIASVIASIAGFIAGVVLTLLFEAPIRIKLKRENALLREAAQRAAGKL